MAHSPSLSTTLLHTRLLRRFGRASRPSPVYRGLIIGALGGLVGTLAMGQYWTRLAPLVQPPSNGPSSHEPSSNEPPAPDRHVISPLGQQHENGEGPTASLGRSAYELIAHQTPGPQTRAALSEAVHWAMGLGSGALYGALSARHGGQPISGGVYGAALWLAADEALVPLLGLQDGPASSDARAHLNRLGAHLSYGVGLGLAVWTLGRVLPD
ncbi:hypothetical protein [Deinococcus sp.]|uniref:hypothetical protein n=1 Tax=Deinococcus sp. TaxID=47478 RepID=UPI0025E6AEF3|nr:hypothetical protein [Deinococcus sp.]